MNTLAVILARSGSQGLSNKHLLPLLGRPVVSYTFDHARAARALTHIVVSSDCPSILRLAESEGFAAIRRPAELATAEASVQGVLLHALDTVEDQGTFSMDQVVVLYGNVPVRPPGCIDRAIGMLTSTGCDSVRTFCPVGKWHPQWMAKIDGDKVEALHAGSIHRRQDLTPLFLHDGGVVACSRRSLLRGRKHPDDPHAFFGKDRRGFIVEPQATVEIDRPVDLYLAEAVLRASRREKSVRIAS